MGDVYLLEPPTAPPTQPTCWSWSGLSSWRRCPRQWWLLRATYPNAPTPYPQPVSPGAVEGTLLHAVVSDFIQYLKRAGESATDQELRAAFNVRKVIQSRLAEVAASVTNPRVDGDRLLARVSVDDCVNAFRHVAPSCLAVGRGQLLPKGVKKQRQHVVGSEVWVEVADPPLCGRPDLSTWDEVIDFKTGEPADKDADQVRFYAILIWLRTGSIPRRLTVVYVHSGKRVEVTPPTMDLLEEAVLTYRSEIAGIAEAIREATAPPLPLEQNCSVCPVRQLCSAYWSATETDRLRLTTQTLTGSSESWRGWLDVEVTRLPTQNQTKGYNGTATVPGVGEVTVSIGPSKVRSTLPKRARLLNAMVEYRGGDYSVTAGVNTEVFWI